MAMEMAFLAPTSITGSGAAATYVFDSAETAQVTGLAQPTQAPSTSSKIAGVTALSLATVAVATGSVAMRRRRVDRAGRRFFQSSAPAPVKPRGPLALPMLPEPEYRTYGDSFLAQADAGFDPLNLASTASPFGNGKSAYWNYREAEVKHGRLAMLASVGWLASESFEPGLAKKYGMPDILAKGELAPSLLNGGLLSLPSFFLPAVLVAAAWIELAPQRKSARSSTLSYEPQLDRMPGDYGFDPLDLAVQSRAIFGKDKLWLHNAETKHGRLGMIAITAFVAQEVIKRTPVVIADEQTIDGAVSTVDKGIETLDKMSGLSIPEIPVPFPGA